jgi:hypothetical protein
MKRLLVLALSLVLGLTATACGDSTGPGAALAGTYHLQFVDGQRLPVRLCDATGCDDLLADEITLDANGSYQSTSHFSSGDVFDAGNWSLSGRDLTLIANDGFTSYGTISGNTITLTNLDGDLITLEYSK